MKKKVLLSSIATIALCLCLIAGSTFALFTSQSHVGIAVTAAKVEMTASISDLELYSVKATKNGTIVDELGGKYEYEGPLTNFANGGTAVLENGILTLDKITPGDKVSFNVQGTNTSDVTIQYRYIVECISGEKLMSGLLVTIEDTTYPILDSYTSVWNTLTPGTNIDPEPIVIEFPVTAGNEYQEESCEIKVTVEAVQGNADVKGSKPVVVFLDGYTGDLANETLTDAVKNYGSVGLTDGTIVLDNVAVENYGELTLTDVTVDGGTPGTIAYGYGIIGQANSETTMNNISFTSANGGVAALDGAKVTFNSGNVIIDSANTSQRYNFYASGEGTVIEINDGTFAFEAYKQRSYVCAINGATVYINGGTFGAAPNHTRWKTPIYTDSTSTVVITGGTFGFNPSDWVADGYVATESNGVWTVSAQ